MLANSPIAPMLPVVSLERARSFYENKLGLPVNEAISSEEALMFDCGSGTQLGIYRRATPTQADHTAAIWIVDDIEEAVRELNARGIEFEHYDLPGLKTNRQGIADVANERAAWFKDPEGNFLGIVQFVG